MDEAERLGAGFDDPPEFKRYLVLAMKRDRTPEEETELNTVRNALFPPPADLPKPEDVPKLSADGLARALAYWNELDSKYLL